MHNPLALEDYAHDVIRERLDRAAHDALVAQLPRPISTSMRVSGVVRLNSAVRLRLASALRAVACRLDDACAQGEPQFVVLNTR